MDSYYTGSRQWLGTGAPPSNPYNGAREHLVVLNVKSIQVIKATAELKLPQHETHH